VFVPVLNRLRHTLRHRGYRSGSGAYELRFLLIIINSSSGGSGDDDDANSGDEDSNRRRGIRRSS